MSFLGETGVLDCPICCDLVDNACETFCGHCFCEFCLHKCLEKEANVCPVCRKDPSPIHASFTIRRIVDEHRKANGLVKEQIRMKTVQEEKQIGNGNYFQRLYGKCLY